MEEQRCHHQLGHCLFSITHGRPANPIDQALIEPIRAWASSRDSGSQSGLKDCQFDLTKARGIGNDVDLDDFSAPDLEIEHDH